MEKLPSMKDIAREAGVSKTAVSLALRNDPQISESRKQQILKIAKSMGYVRNPKIGELMSQMRGAGSGNLHGIIGIINCNQDKHAFRDHATIPSYVEGCKRRAYNLGYHTDSFWLYEPNISAQRWIGILKSRGITGLVMVGMMKQNRVPEFFLPVIEHFPTTVTGVRTKQPALSFACVDHHILSLRAFQKATELGYKRPGLVLEETIDRLVEHRFTAGYRTGQQEIEPDNRLEPFMQVDAAKENLEFFVEWFEKQKPDVIFTLYNIVDKWVRQMGLRVPEDVGLIQLEWRSYRPHWAGMNQHNDICGEAAVDMLINMIYNGDKGFPAFPKATLIGASWIDGETIRYPRKQKAVFA